MDGYRVTALRLNYSYDVRIDHWSGIKGGISAGYSLMNINQNDLLFADQIIRGGSIPSVETGFSDQTSYFDIGAGLLYYNKFVWAGFAVNHLTNPNISEDNKKSIVSELMLIKTTVAKHIDSAADKEVLLKLF